MNNRRPAPTRGCGGGGDDDTVGLGPSWEQESWRDGEIRGRWEVNYRIKECPPVHFSSAFFETELNSDKKVA